MVGTSFKYFANLFSVGATHSATTSMTSSTFGHLWYTAIAVAWNEFRPSYVSTWHQYTSLAI